MKAIINGKIILSVQNGALLNEGKVGTLFGEYNEQTGIDVPAKSVDISDGIQILGTFLFYGCDELSGDIDIHTIGVFLNLSDQTLRQDFFCFYIAHGCLLVEFASQESIGYTKSVFYCSCIANAYAAIT